MKLLDRYIGMQIVWGTLLALAVLLALFTFIAFVDDLDSIGKGNYTLLHAAEYMILTLPRRAFELFPVAALVGSLMGLGGLAGNSELTVVRSSGVSLLRISGSVMKAGALLMIAAVVVGELLAPVCERLAQERRSLALTDQIALRTGYGFWVRDGQSFINIRRVLNDRSLADIYIYEFDGAQRLRVATFARRGRYEGGEWLLEGVSQSVIGEDGVTRRSMDRAIWSSLFAPDLINLLAVTPESLSIFGLYRYLQYLRENNLSTERYELAFWNKLVFPLATGVMIFLAIPLVLGRLQPVGVGQRIVIGTLVGLAFHVIHQTSTHVGMVYALNPALSAAAPTAIFFGVGLWLMRRVR